MDFIETCRQLIAIDSTPAASTRETVDFLQQLSIKLGLHVELQRDLNLGQEQWNFIARPIDGRPDQELLMVTHLDTPDPGPFQHWTKNNHNPFNATIIDKCLYGLGAADVKVDIICKLFAMSEFTTVSRWKLPPVIVGTHSEESGMGGAVKLVRQSKVAARHALVAASTNLRLVSAAKGMAVVEVVIPFSSQEIQYRRDHDLQESTSTQSKFFTGRSAHSSDPNGGESAITKMLEFLAQLPRNIAIMSMEGGTNFNSVPAHALLELDYGFTSTEHVLDKIVNIFLKIKELEKEFLLHQDLQFNPAYPTLNIGVVNTLENAILLKGNARIPPNISQSLYEEWIHKLGSTCQKNGSVLRVLDYKKPFRISDNSIFLKACSDELTRLKLSGEPTTSSTTSEASVFSRLGIECVNFGPGRWRDNAHTPTEHVEIANLELATQFYKNIIQRFCL